MEQVVANMEVEIPEAMVDYEADKLVNNYAQRVTAQGISFDQYLTIMGMTMEQMKEQAKDSARKQIQSDLALGAIVEAEKLEVTDEEADAEIKKLAGEYKMEEEAVRKALILDDLKKDMCRRKAAELVFSTGVAAAKE